MTDTRQWVSVSQAAAALGISTNSVRRRMKDGTLVYEEKERKQGKVYEVLLPDGLEPVLDPNEDDGQRPPTSGPVMRASAPARGEGLTELLARLASAHEREVGLAHQVGQLEATAEQLRSQLELAHDDRGQLSEQLLYETVRRAEAEGRVQALEIERDRLLASGWRRLLGWLVGTPAGLAPQRPGASPGRPG